MKYENGKVRDLKIAYIGGGSRGWAWGLMSDLVSNDDMSGDVALYDIDRDAAKNNEIIGNRYNSAEGAVSEWHYKAVDNIDDALTGADFVIISILPGTFDEMESDVHAPEKYGIYQPVGDTTGPGGAIRALRTIPMYEEFAKAIKKNCPNAWVINYTNPMAVCVNTLYKVFPEIKAFGCCHEVFGTQKFMCSILKEVMDIDATREEININVLGVNHFTWITEAKYKNLDLFPIYRKFAESHAESGFGKPVDDNWINRQWARNEKVKMNLFLRYGYIAAAGDRHLAEFCPGKWYLESPDSAYKDWGFGLTSVKWRKEELARRLERSNALAEGRGTCKIEKTGEEGVHQMRALLGLTKLVTNVNIPNRGQIPNLPFGAVVETNAVFTADSVKPVFAGNVPEEIYPLVSRNAGAQVLITEGGLKRDLSLVFDAFCHDPLVTTSLSDTKKLFNEMLDNTKEYLKMYF